MGCLVTRWQWTQSSHLEAVTWLKELFILSFSSLALGCCPAGRRTLSSPFTLCTLHRLSPPHTQCTDLWLLTRSLLSASPRSPWMLSLTPSSPHLYLLYGCSTSPLWLLMFVPRKFCSESCIHLHGLRKKYLVWRRHKCVDWLYRKLPDWPWGSAHRCTNAH